MRLKAALIIIAIAFAIIAASFCISLFLTRQSLTETVDDDILLAHDISNELVSTRTKLYESNAQTVAGRLSHTASVNKTEDIMREQLEESPNSIAFPIVVFFVASVIVVILVIVASGLIVKLYRKSIEQTRRYDELTETARSQAEIIQGAHQRAILMMDATPICAMLWDRYGRIFDCNAECVKLFKMKDKQDFLDQFFNLSPQYAPDGRPAQEMVKFYINLVFETGWCRIEWMHQMLDGTQVPCEMTLVRVSYADEYIVAAYARDLRDQKHMLRETLRLQNELEAALTEAQEANQAKSNFLASMSHEMRTPLNAVVGLSELVLNSNELQDECTEMLDKIHTSGMMLLGIVNDILDISKIESGKFEMHPVDYDTPSLINDIVALNIIRIGEKPIRFILDVDEKLPGLLFGDELRVKQVFNNLLSNAFKYTDSGTVEWTISSEREGDNIWLVSEIKDTGIGIKPSDISKLFRDYSQVDAQTNRKAEGTGLGLSITKRLAEMMDGTVTVQSTYREGTTFFVRLQQRFVSDEPIGKETAYNLMCDRFSTTKRNRSASLVRIDLSYANVLVVDDIPTNLDVAKGMLAPYGIHIACAVSGPQAIAMIRAESPRYDAVFMDHMMPGMDGIEATRIIREEIGTDYARNLPIIALTANAISGNEKLFLSNGFQAFISKPIDVMRLDSVLRQWVRNKDLEKKHDIKQVNVLDGQTHHTEHNGLPLYGITIDGVDINEGIARFGNSEESFIQVLNSYAINTRPLLEKLKDYLKSENMVDYAITVHGIKGSSFGLCAQKAGNTAERLEKLAKNGEIAQVVAENGAFITYIERLLNLIDNALDEYRLKNKRQAMAAPEPLLLQELREACKQYEAGRVDNVMSQLEAFEYESGAELITWLRGQVEETNYELIACGDWMYKV